jgi:hypothetical protein
VHPDAADVTQSLGLGQRVFVTPQGFFDALAVFDIEIDPDETEHRSIARTERLNATEKPAVYTASISHPKGRLTRPTCSENRFANRSRRLMVVWM